MNYYRRYVGDYLRDTARLSMLEHGAYTLLLDYYYADERALPGDAEEVYIMVRAMTSADRAAVDKILARYFVLESDGHHNARVDSELAIAAVAVNAARENGKLGGRPRKTGGVEKKPRKNPVGLSDETQTLQKQAKNKTQTEPTDNHPPTPNHHPPTTILENLALGAPLNETPAAPLGGQKLAPPAALDGAPRKRLNGSHPKSEKRLAPSTASWAAYSQAYRERYHVDPVRNKQANSMLCKLVEMLGEEDAPQVAAFYVGHNKAWYVEHGHNLGSLVKDADWLRTQWVTGRTVTSGQARQADRTQGQANIWNEIISEERDKERAINER